MRTRFSDCLLDSETRKLLRGGKPVHLSPKAFELIELLPAEAVSKPQIHERLWPKTFRCGLHPDQARGRSPRRRWRRCPRASVHPQRSRLRIRVLRQGLRREPRWAGLGHRRLFLSAGGKRPRGESRGRREYPGPGPRVRALDRRRERFPPPCSDQDLRRRSDAGGPRQQERHVS